MHLLTDILAACGAVVVAAYVVAAILMLCILAYTVSVK